MITEMNRIIQIQITISRTLQIVLEPWACKSEIHHALMLRPCTQFTFCRTSLLTLWRRRVKGLDKSGAGSRFRWALRC